MRNGEGPEPSAEELELRRQREASEEMELAARADAHVFRRAAWVWGSLSVFGSVSAICMGLVSLGVGSEVLFYLSLVSGFGVLPLLLPAGTTAMQVAGIVWRRWRESRRD